MILFLEKFFLVHVLLLQCCFQIFPLLLQLLFLQFQFKPLTLCFWSWVRCGFFFFFCLSCEPLINIFLLLLVLVGLHLLLIFAFLFVSSNLTDLKEVIKLIRILVVFDVSADNVFALESSDLIIDVLAELIAHPVNIAILYGVVSLLLLLFDFDLVALFPVELIDLLLLLESFLFE